jgi:hypothetical protein
MAKFYVVYPLGSKIQDCYSILEARDLSDALALVEQAGVATKSVYPAEFEKNISRYGLKLITLAAARKELPL